MSKKNMPSFPKRILKDPTRFKKLVDKSIHFAS